MNEWELTDEERIKLVSRWVRAGLETELPRDKDAIDLVDMVQKASHKKLVEWLQQYSQGTAIRVNFWTRAGEKLDFKSVKGKLPVRLSIPKEDWQELCKGVK